MITIVAKSQVKPECLEDYIKLAKELVAASQAETGNVSYHLYQAQEDPCTLTMIECWKDQAAIESHNASAAFQTIVPQLGKMRTASEVLHYDIVE